MCVCLCVCVCVCVYVCVYLVLSANKSMYYLVLLNDKLASQLMLKHRPVRMYME